MLPPSTLLHLNFSFFVDNNYCPVSKVKMLKKKSLQPDNLDDVSDLVPLIDPGLVAGHAVQTVRLVHQV